MITLNDTPLEDKQAIFLVRITFDNSALYCAYPQDITLSSNTYSAAIIQDRSIEAIEKEVDPEEHGGIGSVGRFSFSIARYGSNTLIDDFFNDFYPATSAKYISSRKVEVGIIWEGETLESAITWIWEGYVEDYSYNDSQISLFCVEYDEFEYRNLPYYKLQDSFDNGISYFTSAPQDNYGSAVPILYGSFQVDTMDVSGTNYPRPYKKPLAPLVCVDEYDYKFILASHEVNAINYPPYKYSMESSTSFGSTNNNTTPDLYRYNDELGYFINIYNFDLASVAVQQTSSNGVGGATFYLKETGTNYDIYGDTVIYFDKVTNKADAIKKISNDSNTSYVTLDAGEYILPTFERNDQDNVYGYGDITTNSYIVLIAVLKPAVNMTVRLSSTPEGSGVTKFNDASLTGGTTYYMEHSIDIYSADNWKNVFTCEYKIENRSGTAGDLLYVYQVWLGIYRFTIEGFRRELKQFVNVNYPKLRLKLKGGGLAP